MARRLKIVQVGKYYPPHVGGMETHLQALCGGLKVAHDVQVFVANEGRRDEDSVVDGVTIHRLGSQFEIAGASICPTMPWRIRRARADIVHLHVPNPAGVLAILASGYRGRLIVTWHSDIIRQRRLAKMFEPIQRRFLANCDAIIATSPNYAESSPDLRRLKKRTVVIPYGIEAAEFCAPPDAAVAAVKRGRSTPLLIAVGRLVYYKGFEYLVRAMARIDATLMLVGDGPLRDPLERLAREIGVASRIEFLGEMQPREIVPYYHAADIFVLPSIARSEAFGIVQLEAMACGKPVVNTNLESGVPFASLDGVTGITVEPANADALAGAVNRLLGDASLRAKYGEAAKRRVQSEFTVGVMVQRTRDLYEATMNGTGAHSAAESASHPRREAARGS
jgi:glycosyltransferase involved in cell wall biosynthesis